MKYSPYWFLLFAISVGSACCAEVVSVAEALSSVGKTVTVELPIISAKHAHRRKTHFLSSEANFRGPTHLAIAIRDGSQPAFEQAGIKNLGERFVGKTVRATGVVFQNEGQTLLLVEKPDQIEILGAAESSAPVSEVTIVDPAGEETKLALPLAKELKREKIVVEHEGVDETYEGVPLAAALEQAKIELGQPAHGKAILRYVIVTGDDGYETLLSIGEIDPFVAREKILLAESQDGQTFDRANGPLRLIIPQDKVGRRWVKRVAKVRVIEAKPAAKP